MTNEPLKFNFFNQVTEYAKTLGGLCPHPSDDPPKKGDTIEIAIDLLGVSGIDFLGVLINQGTIVEVIKFASFRKLKSIVEQESNLDDGDISSLKVCLQESFHFIEEDFDFEDFEPRDVHNKTRAVSVKFSVKVPDKFVQEQIGSADGMNPKMKLTSGKIKAKIVGTKHDGYFLTGLLKGLITGKSVTSTKAMDAFKKKHATRTRVENVAWSDRVLPSRLLRELNESLDEICQKEPADYHPGSGKVVRDIVHPSMYCYVKGVSTVNGIPGNPLGEKAAESEESRRGEDFWGREYKDSSYQWLPAEFFVSNDGSVRIDSYVNNLDRQKYPHVYTNLERMFERTLPMFEAVCGSLRNDLYWTDEVYKGSKSISLRDRSLQVVTKIVEYRVNREENFDGVWHVEGMSHEEILATALCIVKRDENFAGAEIEFRRFLFQEEGDELASSTPQNAHRPTDTMGSGDVRPLGRMKTPADRVVVFPNSHIHRLSSMYSSDGIDATRRIVVFWLVNPDRPIISTANVPAQQGVISLDDAVRNRLTLMAARKVHKEDYNARSVDLCEH